MKSFFGGFLADLIKEHFPEIPYLMAKGLPLVAVVAWTAFFKRYVFGDFNFVIFLGVVILLDTLSKVYFILLKKEKFDFEVLVKKLGLKILKYFIYIAAMHVFLNLEVDGKSFNFGFYVRYLVYSLLILRDVSSIMKNLGITLPKEIQKYIDRDKDEETTEELKDKVKIQKLDEDRPGGGPRLVGDNNETENQSSN